MYIDDPYLGNTYLGEYAFAKYQTERVRLEVK